MEILVALAILAIVACIVVGQYLSVRTQAMWTVAGDMETELNSTFNNWLQMGGVVGTTGNPTGQGGGNVYTSDLLDMFASNAQYSFMPGDASREIVDSSGVQSSQPLRVALSGGAQTTTQLRGASQRGCYSDSSQQYMIVYYNPMKYFGVVPIINGQMRIYFWGTGDGSRQIISEAVGKTTVAVLQYSGLAWEYAPLTGFPVETNGADVIQGIEDGLVLPSANNPGAALGPNPYPTLDRSIAIFSKHLDSNGQPIITDQYNVGETFFNDSQQTALWASALASLQ